MISCSVTYLARIPSQHPRLWSPSPVVIRMAHSHSVAHHIPPHSALSTAHSARPALTLTLSLRPPPTRPPIPYSTLASSMARRQRRRTLSFSSPYLATEPLQFCVDIRWYSAIIFFNNYNYYSYTSCPGNKMLINILE